MANRNHNWTNREADIKVTNFPYLVSCYSTHSLCKAQGSRKTPKRLKPVLKLLDTMIWRHGKCAYKALRDKVCPTKVCTVMTPSQELTGVIVCLF
jgi:hypothetical protein